MISAVAWAATFAAWFWIDGSLFDPAVAKEILLPIAMGLLMLVNSRKWIPGGLVWLVAVFMAWSILGIGEISRPTQSVLLVGSTATAFLVGATRSLPPPWIAIGALSLAIATGWCDLLFLSNLGGGIPTTPTSFFIHRNLFALVLGPSLVLLAGWLATFAHDRSAKWLGWTIFALGSSLLLVSGSRGAILGFMAATVLVVVRQTLMKSMPASRILAVAVVLIVFFVGLGTLSGRLTQTRTELNSMMDGVPISKKVQDRFRPWVWRGAMRLWSDSPVVGIGVGDFRYEIESVLDPWMDVYRARRLKVDVAHSHWLQTLVERGMTGFLLELAIWLLAMAMALRGNRTFLAAALLGMGVHGIVSEGFEYSQGAVLWWFLIGLALSGTTQVGRSVPVRRLGAAALVLLSFPLIIEARSIWGEQILHRVVSSGKVADPERLQSAWRAAPRSAAILQEIGRLQARSGAIQEARATLEYRRSLYPKAGSAGGEELLAGIWRTTGALDSAESLLRSNLLLFPSDPWLFHELLRLRRVSSGCEGARKLLDSAGPSIDSVFERSLRAKVDTRRSWRSRLVVDRDLVDSIASREPGVIRQDLAVAWKEWTRARRFCAEPEK